MQPPQFDNMKPTMPAHCARPSDPQERSPFFRLPWEIRDEIYNIAFPRIASPQLVYTSIDDKISFNTIGTALCGDHHLCRIVCNGVFEDNGIEINGRRKAARVTEDDNMSPYKMSLREIYCRFNDQLIYPLSLLLTCRRMYDDVAPHCDQSLAFQDFVTLESFLSRSYNESLASGLLDRLNKVCLDVKFTHDCAFTPSTRKKILASWIAACKRLANIKRMHKFLLRLEIPLSQQNSVQNSVPGNAHITMIKELNPLAAHVREIEVQLMLTSVVHPKSERVWSYQPGPPGNNRGFQVPGWTERIAAWGSFIKLDEAEQHKRV